MDQNYVRRFQVTYYVIKYESIIGSVVTHIKLIPLLGLSSRDIKFYIG
jgi:hypothetical protein